MTETGRAKGGNVAAQAVLLQPVGEFVADAARPVGAALAGDDQEQPLALCDAIFHSHCKGLIGVGKAVVMQVYDPVRPLDAA